MNDSSCAPAHNTPLPLERSPPASFKRLLGRWPSRIDELLQGEANIASDLSEQRGRDISTLVDRNRGDATIGVTELFVRTALADLSEPQPL